jgi:hypothetical protein
VIWRRPPIDPDTLPDDLGVDWSRWADGRAYRLKRKRDFPNVDPGLARTACTLAATRMGKAARTVRDKMVPDKLIWVQFGDAAIEEGDPCPRCGSRRLLRLHGGFARCPECNAQLVFGLESVAEGEQGAEEAGPSAEADAGAAAPDPSAKQRQKSVARLQTVTNLHLKYARETATTDLYNGYGDRETGHAIVAAEFRRVKGEKLTSENIWERLVWAGVYPAAALSDLVDFDALQAQRDSDWDLVLASPPLPEPDEPLD